MIHKILSNFQKKHKNARYNPEPFENTKCLAFCIDQVKKKKSMFAALDSEGKFPDVNFGINSVSYAILGDNDHVIFGNINHNEFIQHVNDVYTITDGNGIFKIKKDKVKHPFQFETNIQTQNDSTLLLFINFYHFLDKNDNPKCNINLKMTYYMARFENIKSKEPVSILQKISKKQTKYYTDNFYCITY